MFANMRKFVICGKLGFTSGFHYRNQCMHVPLEYFFVVVEQTDDLPTIWDALILIWRFCNTEKIGIYIFFRLTQFRWHWINCMVRNYVSECLRIEISFSVHIMDHSNFILTVLYISDIFVYLLQRNRITFIDVETCLDCVWTKSLNIQQH